MITMPAWAYVLVIAADMFVAASIGFDVGRGREQVRQLQQRIDRERAERERAQDEAS